MKKNKKPKELEDSRNQTEIHVQPSLDALLIQLDVCTMLTTPPPAMLRRLQQLCGQNTGHTGERGAQKERTRWMLSMIQTLHGEKNDVLREGRLENDAISKPQMMVVLYESPGT